MEPTHTETYNGKFIAIYPDTDAENPRTSFDNVGTMTCFHGRYHLGDEHNYGDPLHFTNSLYQEFHPDADDFDTVAEAQEALDKCPIIWLPLYLYDHSGITMNTTGFHCPWDSGQVGIIYVTLEKAREEWPLRDGETDEQWDARVREYLRGEVSIYDKYISGEVYGFRIFDSDDAEGEFDACWGFYGLDDAISGAKEAIGA